MSKRNELLTMHQVCDVLRIKGTKFNKAMALMRLRQQGVLQGIRVSRSVICYTPEQVADCLTALAGKKRRKWSRKRRKLWEQRAVERAAQAAQELEQTGKESSCN